MLLRYVTFFIILLCLCQACSRKIINPKQKADNQIQNWSQDIDFRYLQGKAKILYKNKGNEQKMKATIRIRKDSAIWMLFSFAGITVGKIKIDYDSITFINHIEKWYTTLHYEELSKKLDTSIDYPFIESALLGNSMFNKTSSVDDSLYTISKNSNNVYIAHDILPEFRRIKTTRLRKEGEKSDAVNIDYMNFSDIGGQIFPFKTIIKLQDKDKKSQLLITLQYTDVVIGTNNLSMPFSIPKKYERR